MTISNQSRERVKKVFEPIALGMGRLGLTPDALTFLGFVITVVGAVLIAGQLWLAGGLVILFGGIFDMFDGTLARATGRVTTFGAFMDSVFDRAGEVIVYLGMIAGLQANGVPNGPLFAAAAMGAAVMVSYTRSKSEGLGFTSGTGMASIGIMPREVRLIVLSLGLIAAGALGKITETLLIALAIIAIGATITVIQRILHVRSQAKSAPITTIQ
ncbi:MAG: CDP-diacylglycerol---glycerol-3-phosphate 3-phosphatidyltransferase [Chloroflexota bacterium]|nr:CDP-diacylglycerol---glycerol-3-phosphate 3-phosphatidyltransferase [Chloroflexota bacterium]